MSFEITFLGASGGPIESNTCGLLVKPANVTYKEMIETNANPLLVIDGGSGAAALAHIIRDPTAAVERHLLLYPDAWKLKDYLAMEPTYPFLELSSGNSLAASLQVISRVQSVLLTHPHLDHISALVVNLAGLATCKRTRPLTVYGSRFCMEALDKHIFNGLIWPDLVLAKVLGLKSVQFDQLFEVNDGYYEITMLELSHGIIEQTDKPKSMAHVEELKFTKLKNGFSARLRSSKVPEQSHISDLSHFPDLPRNSEVSKISDQPAGNSSTQSHDQYTSLAFLVCHKTTGSKILVFGDFESDLVLGTNRNKHVWKKVAPYVADGTLKGIVLECSLPTVDAATDLYGHLMPPHLIGELQTLHEHCVLETSLHPLENLNVVVTHVKELPLHDPRRKVLSELRELNEKHQLRLRISVAISGVLVVI